MNAVTEVMDELRKALSEVDDIRASLRRKVRHCDELIEERDQMERERDEARAEVDELRSHIARLRGVLHIVSLDEYESTSSASEKVHLHARQARIVLNETLAEITPSDAAHVASLENLFLKACRRAEKWETTSKDAYRRGAEAMREACIGYAHKIGFHGLTVDIRALPIPEEP